MGVVAMKGGNGNNRTWATRDRSIAEPVRRTFARQMRHAPTEAERKLYRSFDVINDGIAPGSDHMIEGQFTICDIYLTMIARWSRFFARPMWHWANVNRVVLATHPRPAFQRMLQKQGITWPETWGR